MLKRYTLRDDQRERIKDLLPGHVGPTPETPDGSLMQCCTAIARAFLGAIYPRTLATFGWCT